MMLKTIALSPALTGSLITVLFLFATPSSATTIWTDWTSATGGAPGSASGLVNGVTVAYLGELDSAVTNGTSTIWAPDSSFSGGTVTTSPSTVADDIRLNGTFTGVNTITFGSLVEPVFAIWSLGQPGLGASFLFNETPTLQAGGPNSLFVGQSITVNGNTVSGNEGNGVVQFTGCRSSISWSNTPENFYAFTVGINDTSCGSVAAVPEPASLSLLGIGLAGLIAMRRYKV